MSAADIDFVSKDLGAAQSTSYLMRDIAQRGVSGPVSRFPYESRIRSGFGRFAPERMEAVRGVRAQAANQALGSSAFAFGPRAAFGAAPDLHTAAHEAAHMAAAPYGVRLTDGVGQAGDRHEQVADQAADAIVAGRSAEPVFETAYGGVSPIHAGGPLLQMKNKITNHTSSKEDTPWKQISDQLGINYATLEAHLGVISGGFATMAGTLKTSCERAQSVTAELDGIRPGGIRQSDPTQTAYGNLGDFMAFITRTPQPEAFEGGHLISDKLLGTDSYVQYNFAPQRSSLNAPHYRKIEELAEGGAVDKSTGAKASKWHYTAQLTYDSATTNVPTSTVLAQLGYTGSPTLTPSHVTLNTWVPHLWQTKLTADDPMNDVFDGVSTVDTSQTTGAAKGFLGKDATAKFKSQPLLGTADTLKYYDVAHWGMDTMEFKVPGQSNVRTTGTGLDRQAEHTWTGVQSPPRAQSSASPGGGVFLPPAQAPSNPTYTEALNFEGGFVGDSLSGTTLSWAKRRKRLLLRLRKIDKTSGITQRAYKDALDEIGDWHWIGSRFPRVKKKIHKVKFARKGAIEGVQKRRRIKAVQARENVRALLAILHNLDAKSLAMLE